MLADGSTVRQFFTNQLIHPIKTGPGQSVCRCRG